MYLSLLSMYSLSRLLKDSEPQRTNGRAAIVDTGTPPTRVNPQLIQGAPITDHKNGFVNLAAPFVAFSEPLEAEPIDGASGGGGEGGFTIWDKVVVDGAADLTVRGLVEFLKSERGAAEVSMISYKNAFLYASFMHGDVDVDDEGEGEGEGDDPHPVLDTPLWQLAEALDTDGGQDWMSRDGGVSAGGGVDVDSGGDQVVDQAVPASPFVGGDAAAGFDDARATVDDGSGGPGFAEVYGDQGYGGGLYGVVEGTAAAAAAGGGMGQDGDWPYGGSEGDGFGVHGGAGAGAGGGDGGVVGNGWQGGGSYGQDWQAQQDAWGDGQHQQASSGTWQEGFSTQTQQQEPGGVASWGGSTGSAAFWGRAGREEAFWGKEVNQWAATAETATATGTEGPAAAARASASDEGADAPAVPAREEEEEEDPPVFDWFEEEFWGAAAAQGEQDEQHSNTSAGGGAAAADVDFGGGSSGGLDGEVFRGASPVAAGSGWAAPAPAAAAAAAATGEELAEGGGAAAAARPGGTSTTTTNTAGMVLEPPTGARRPESVVEDGDQERRRWHAQDEEEEEEEEEEEGDTRGRQESNDATVTALERGSGGARVRQRRRRRYLDLQVFCDDEDGEELRLPPVRLDMRSFARGSGASPRREREGESADGTVAAEVREGRRGLVGRVWGAFFGPFQAGAGGSSVGGEIAEDSEEWSESQED
ncbi:unnamed protein product [Ectocarpus sp. 12 AP-2014]